MKHHQKVGFTLAELLITVGLVGAIAAISIPGVLSGIETTNRRAKMKDTLKIITEATEALTVRGGSFANTYQAILSQIRYLDKNDTTRIITLHNGVTLHSFNGGCGGSTQGETIAIDLRGQSRDALVADDVVWVVANWAPNNNTLCSSSVADSITGGMVQPIVRADMPNNLALYRELTR
jgi:type II secretory pathway pseudopilin PulG